MRLVRYHLRSLVDILKKPRVVGRRSGRRRRRSDFGLTGYPAAGAARRTLRNCLISDQRCCCCTSSSVRPARNDADQKGSNNGPYFRRERARPSVRVACARGVLFNFAWQLRGSNKKRRFDSFDKFCDCGHPCAVCAARDVHSAFKTRVQWHYRPAYQ